MSVFRPEAKNQAGAVGLSLHGRVKEFFQDKQHRKDFEVWFKKTYGRPYVWKTEGGA